MFLSNRKSCCAVARVRSRLSKRNAFCQRGIVYGECPPLCAITFCKFASVFLLVQVMHLSVNPQKNGANLLLAVVLVFMSWHIFIWEFCWCRIFKRVRKWRFIKVNTSSVIWNSFCVQCKSIKISKARIKKLFL